MADDVLAAETSEVDVVHAAEHADYGSVTRGDVAHVLAEVLATDSTVGKTFDVVGGETPIAEAVGKI